MGLNSGHIFHNIKKRTKYQDNIYKGHVSKLSLQETVLALAQFYSKFPKIYFPVRLYQRDIVYTEPNF